MVMKKVNSKAVHLEMMRVNHSVNHLEIPKAIHLEMKMEIRLVNQKAKSLVIKKVKKTESH